MLDSTTLSVVLSNIVYKYTCNTPLYRKKTRAIALTNTSHVSSTRVNTSYITPASHMQIRTCGIMHYTHASHAMCATTQLSYLYTVMCEMIQTKIDPRQGGCLGLCTLVYETVIIIKLGHTLEARCTIEFDEQRYKRRSIRVLDATPARMQITQSQHIDNARIVISTTGLTLTECCQSVYCEGVSCCTATVIERH